MKFSPLTCKIVLITVDKQVICTIDKGKRLFLYLCLHIGVLEPPVLADVLTLMSPVQVLLDYVTWLSGESLCGCCGVVLMSEAFVCIAFPFHSGSCLSG